MFRGVCPVSAVGGGGGGAMRSVVQALRARVSKISSLRSRPHPARRATFSRFAGEGLPCTARHGGILKAALLPFTGEGARRADEGARAQRSVLLPFTRKPEARCGARHRAPHHFRAAGMMQRWPEPPPRTRWSCPSPRSADPKSGV